MCRCVTSISAAMLIDYMIYSWWRHQMETFSALLALCAGNSPVTGEFPAQRPVTRSFDGFYDFRLNKRLSKESWGWWSETPSCPLWRNCNVCEMFLWVDAQKFHAQHCTGSRTQQNSPRNLAGFRRGSNSWLQSLFTHCPTMIPIAPPSIEQKSEWYALWDGN